MGLLHPKRKIKELQSRQENLGQNYFQSSGKRVRKEKIEIKMLDLIDDVMGIEEEEIIERNRLYTELLRGKIWKEKMMHQKVKNPWIKERDVNSRFYHKWIKKRANINSIEGLLVGNRWVKDVEEIKSAIYGHFNDLISAKSCPHIRLLEDLFYNTIDDCDYMFLCTKFTKEEVKNAI